jgi:hypothetical protein
MRDAGYIAAGYLLTGAAITTYAVSVRGRLHRTLRQLRHWTPGRDEP